MPRDLQALAAALSQRLPQGNRVTGVRQLSDGFSNETYLVEGLDQILRMPPTESPLLAPNRVHDVTGQYAILEEWGATTGAPPVPRAVCLETDPAVLGAPFFLMDRVACDVWGDFGAPDWVMQADDALRGRVAEEFTEAYARLHRQAPFKAFGPTLTNRDELDRWAAPVRDIDAPTLNAAFALLDENAPRDAAPAPCHGDAKPANILWKDGRIVAMLDHEMSFNGDPRWDLGGLLQALKDMSAHGKVPLDAIGFWGRERMIAEWSARTGRSADHLVWFEAASRARYASILAYGGWLFATGQANDKRFGVWAPVMERLSQNALDLARRHAEGLG